MFHISSGMALHSSQQKKEVTAAADVPAVAAVRLYSVVSAEQVGVAAADAPALELR